MAFQTQSTPKPSVKPAAVEANLKSPTLLAMVWNCCFNCEGY